MDSTVFLLATDPHDQCRDVIHSRDTSLKVKVFCLDVDDFKPNLNEVQLYGYAGEKLYGFETMNITPEDALDVISAIQWYADYIECPDMEILPEDPRHDADLAM